MNLQLLNAEDLGIRLEVAGNLRIWEPSPVIKHQLEIDRIRDSIKKTEKDGKTCECIDIADIYVQFADGSLKRPDVSIFCKMPEEEEEAHEFAAAFLMPEEPFREISELNSEGGKCQIKQVAGHFKTSHKDADC